MNTDWNLDTGPSNEGDEYLTKEDLVGSLVVAETLDYDPSKQTPKSPDGVPTWRGNILVVDGKHAGKFIEDQMFWSNLAKQLGRIPVGSSGPGRVSTGKTGKGQWFGFDRLTSEDEADLNKCKAAVDAHEDKPAF